MSHCLHDGNFATNLQGKLVGLYMGLLHYFHGVLSAVCLVDSETDFAEGALAEDVEHEVLADAGSRWLGDGGLRRGGGTGHGGVLATRRGAGDDWWWGRKWDFGTRYGFKVGSYRRCFSVLFMRERGLALFLRYNIAWLEEGLDSDDIRPPRWVQTPVKVH